MLDRMDIQIELPSLSFDEISTADPHAETSATIRARVIAARAFARRRMEAEGAMPRCNAQLTPSDIHKYCKATDSALILLRQAYDRLGLSARGHDRILRVARTIADLDASDTIREEHIAQAIQLRSLDRKYWH
jgi:magnesium chelatase family protein